VSTLPPPHIAAADHGSDQHAGTEILDKATEERLAKRLCETMEHLDPVGKEWDDLDEHDRTFYRVCVEVIVAEYKYRSG